ncbi:peptidoglycan-binding protein [Phaeobacter sp. B1627]|nr:peptidoglycan-binding protein [Phaeobacter sp. B1627]
MSLARLLVIALPLLTLACTGQPPFERVGRAAPPGAPPGTCWDTIIIPARVETVTEQVMIAPPVKSTDGQVLEPAVFASETRQQITRPREESYFETPCPEAMTAEYIASLQRALAARGAYGGAITGLLGADTRAAIRAYQLPLGIDSTTLSLRAARDLGLSAVHLPT